MKGGREGGKEKERARRERASERARGTEREMEGRERAGERGSEERDQTDGGNYIETESHYSETESHYSETESLSLSLSLSRWALAGGHAGLGTCRTP